MEEGVTRTILWAISALAATTAALAAVADRRRAHRRELDRVGWAPWSGISVAALFVAVIAAALAVRTSGD